MKANKTTRVWEASNNRKRKGKSSESSIDLAAHNQNLTQQWQDSPLTYQY
jgi:hypothetical protein